MDLIVNPVPSSAGVDDITLQKQQLEEEEEKKTGTASKTSKKHVVVWPEFKIPLPDPVLGEPSKVLPFCLIFIKGFTGEIFSGKGALSPEQTLVEFISTSAAFHEVKKQPLRSLEWDLLKASFLLVKSFLFPLSLAIMFLSLPILLSTFCFNSRLAISPPSVPLLHV